MQQYPAPGGDVPATELFRPVGREELELIAAAGWAAFPPRRSWQPIFYPMLRLENARKTAQELNSGDAAHAAPAWVVRFRVRNDVLSSFDLHNSEVDGGLRAEFRVPAESLTAVNAGIVGRIEVVEAFGDDELPDDDDETLRQRRLATAYDALMQGIAAILRSRADDAVPADGGMGEAQAWASRLQPADDAATLYTIIRRYVPTDAEASAFAADLWPIWQRFLGESGRFDESANAAAPPVFVARTAAAPSEASTRLLGAVDFDADGRSVGVRIDVIPGPDGSSERILSTAHGASVSLGDSALARPFRFSRLVGARGEAFGGPLPLPHATTLDDIGDGVLATWSTQLSGGSVRAALLETDVRAVRPGGDVDYFAREQMAAWGPDPFWELAHDPRVTYLRAADTQPAPGISGFNFVVPIVPLSWADPSLVAAATSEIADAGRPTCVTLGVIDAHEVSGPDGPVRHLCAVHVVIAGTAALRACLDAGVTPRFLTFVDMARSGAPVAGIDAWLRQMS